MASFVILKAVCTYVQQLQVTASSISTRKLAFFTPFRLITVHLNVTGAVMHFILQSQAMHDMLCSFHAPLYTTNSGCELL